MTRACGHCGAPFEVDENDGRTRGKRWCSGKCRRGAHENARRASCSDCGAALGAGSGYPGNPTTRCRACHTTAEAARVAERAHEIERWWAEGVKLREIAERLGWSMGRMANEMDRLRKKGFDLPLRHKHFTAQRIAEVERLWADGLTGAEIGRRIGWVGVGGPIAYLRRRHDASLPARRAAA